MLRQLHVENLVLAREVTLQLSSGLNLITGETGGGKSLLVAALSLAAGARADADMIRQGEERAVVEALFDLTSRQDAAKRFAGAGLVDDDAQYVVRREVGSDGRSRAWVNGSPVTLTVLRALVADLVEIHGQHEFQSLFSPERQRELLDRFSGTGEQLSAVAAAAAEVKELDEKCKALEENALERAHRREMAEFKVETFDQVAPLDGEDDELSRERERLRHAEAIGEAVRTALANVYEGEGSSYDKIHAGARSLSAQGQHDERLALAAERLEEVGAELADVASELNSLADGASPDSDRLAEIEDRLHAIERLRRRFDGAPLSEIADRVEKLRAELDELGGDADAKGELEARRERALEEFRARAGELSEARAKGGEEMASTVTGHLAQLAMKEALVTVEISSAELDALSPGEVSPYGVDEVELGLRANPGEPLRPLRRVASGGELSRVMLAIDVALGAGLPPRLLLFDEVDQGLGGEAAERLGRFVARLARHQQIVCITHLPQVAAHADVHVTVNKKVRSGRTIAVVKTLKDAGDRVDEIARMIGGKHAGETARRHAEAMVASISSGRSEGAPRRRGA